MPPFKPNVEMTRAVSDILQRFAEQWPRANSMRAWYRDEASRNEMIATWAEPLARRRVSIIAIPDAARRWMGDHIHVQANGLITIPNPATFAKYAQMVDQDSYRAHHVAAAASTSLPGRAHDLGMRAYRALGNWTDAARVTGELLKLAPDDAAAQRIKDSRIGYTDADPWPRLEHFDQAIEIVRADMEMRAALKASDARERKVS